MKLFAKKFFVLSVAILLSSLCAGSKVYSTPYFINNSELNYCIDENVRDFNSFFSKDKQFKRLNFKARELNKKSSKIDGRLRGKYPTELIDFAKTLSDFYWFANDHFFEGRKPRSSVIELLKYHKRNVEYIFHLIKRSGVCKFNDVGVLNRFLDCRIAELENEIELIKLSFYKLHSGEFFSKSYNSANVEYCKKDKKRIVKKLKDKSFEFDMWYRICEVEINLILNIRRCCNLNLFSDMYSIYEAGKHYYNQY